jgi:hypothetical protein
VVEGEFEQGAVAGEFQLLANVAAVRFHGAMADEEFAANLFVRFVLGHQAKDAAFLLVESVLLKLRRDCARGAVVIPRAGELAQGH